VVGSSRGGEKREDKGAPAFAVSIPRRTWGTKVGREGAVGGQGEKEGGRKGLTNNGHRLSIDA
jgi:hypothetical protein